METDKIFKDTERDYNRSISQRKKTNTESLYRKSLFLNYCNRQHKGYVKEKEYISKVYALVYMSKYTQRAYLIIFS